MEELKVGASFLRSLNSHALERLDQKIVVHAEGVPVAVVMPWAEHERLVGLAPVMVGGVPDELKTQVGKILSGVEHLLTLEQMMEALVRHVVEALTTPRPMTERPMAPSLPPSHMVDCKHCGERRFGATKFATVCSECKSTGHTSPPEECPRCTEGAGL